jgi:hypothetical protein
LRRARRGGRFGRQSGGGVVIVAVLQRAQLEAFYGAPVQLISDGNRRISSRLNLFRNVRSWHLADMPVAVMNVRFWG